MYDINKHMRVLELNKVLEMLAAHTCTADGAEQARQIVPTGDEWEVNELLRETYDAHSLHARYTSPSFGAMHNIKGSLTRAAAGASLSTVELLDVAEALRVMRGLCEYRERAGADAAAIDKYFDRITPNKYIEDKITAAIISRDEISDRASSALAEIRRKKRSAEASVRERLDRIIRSADYQKYLQDAVITMRGGRFVIPVKTECRANVPGLVHDTSSSGATVFIEPTAVVEANNDIKVLESKESDEIARILAELSAEVGSFSEPIASSYDAAVVLDVIFAKAKLAYEMKASLPQVGADGVINLLRARHPLLDKQTVVPIDVSLGGGFDTLIITGPNTGGKTVTLKLIGLLTLMAECGLMLPVADGSRVSVFDRVMADIGDEQSIEQSLSTFSSHITNLVDIISDADEHSLVLVDELGAGTDPVEGAALATAIIERLRQSGCRIAATTHYAELKAFALDTAGVENACCEFDIETLRPTYRLLIGVPGRSNAFAISSRLGIESDVVRRAEQLVSDDSARFERVVVSLEQARHEAERESGEAARLREQLSEQSQSVSRRLEEAERRCEEMLEKARADAARITERAGVNANRLIGEIEQLHREAKNSSNRSDLLRQAKEALRKADKKASEGVSDGEQIRYAQPRPLRAGDRVMSPDLGGECTVLSPPDSSGRVQVQMGAVKSKVSADRLKLLEDKPKKKPQTRLTRNVVSNAERSVSRELDLRGKTVDEALAELDMFIDGAVLGGVDVITIIHGKGTGALRTAVQNELRSHKSVRTYRLGTFGEGESGVTIAQLK